MIIKNSENIWEDRKDALSGYRNISNEETYRINKQKDRGVDRWNSYAAVSKAYHRFDIKLKGDKSLVKVIKKLEDRMSHV